MNPIPQALIDYVEAGRPAYGFTDYEFWGYFNLETPDNIGKLNKDIQIEEYAPGFTAFGSDGGGEVFVFDAKGVIYLMPLVGMEPKAAVKVADSWSDFESHIQNEEEQDEQVRPANLANARRLTKNVRV